MRISIYLAFTLIAIFCQTVAAREWSDKTGKFKTVADFVKVDGDKVVLKKTGGAEISVPINRLSAKDQAYLRQLMSKESESADDGTSEAAAGEAPKGTLFGEPFEPVIIKMQGDQLKFASDEEFFPAQSIQMFLFAQDKGLEGQQFSVREESRALTPHIHLKSKQPPKSEVLFNGYTMDLSFGKKQGNQLVGRIKLQIPQHKTEISGTFSVVAPKNYKLPPTAEDAPYIVAEPKLSPSVGQPEYLTGGYFGLSKAGKRISNLAGTGWRDGGYVASTTHEPRVTALVFEKGKPQAQHLKLEPGKYFHYFVLNQSYLVGEWVEVESDSQIETSLDVDTSDAGLLEVETTSQQRVFLAPVDVLESMTEPKLDAKSLAYSLGLSAEPENGKAQFKLLRPGKYIVVSGKQEQPVEIGPGENQTIKLAE